MLKVTRPKADRVDITLEGTLDAETMRQGLDDLIAETADMANGQMLYRIGDFSWPSAGALAVELTRLPQLYQLLGKISRCAVITDIAWLRRAAEVEGALIPGLEIKSFDLGEDRAALDWLAKTNNDEDEPFDNVAL